MIRVLVELWPGGLQSESQILGQVGIVNVSPMDGPATYLAAIVDANGDLITASRVSEHERARGWLALLGAVLANDDAFIHDLPPHILDAVTVRLRQATSS